jgi:ATP-dependent protease ClpP protease subunit
MNRIELRGVIVPSEYDSSWAEGYIAKGIIIPESRFRSMLASANKKEPLTVYVNSPGGSVFAAGEMVNAVREWKAETGQPVTVVLGALTASAASAFAIMVADQIKAHSNAKMMFHGAWTVSVGGAEMHGDTSELLEKINADIKTRLVSKYGMSPETVTEWFSEGREGWLNATDLVDAKRHNQGIGLIAYQTFTGFDAQVEL